MGMAVCTTLHSRPKLFLLIFDNIEKKNIERVPEDIDDTYIYTEPMKKGTLNHCNRKRPLGHAESSKT